MDKLYKKDNEVRVGAGDKYALLRLLGMYAIIFIALGGVIYFDCLSKSSSAVKTIASACAVGAIILVSYMANHATREMEKLTISKANVSFQDKSGDTYLIFRKSIISARDITLLNGDKMDSSSGQCIEIKARTSGVSFKLNDDSIISYASQYDNVPDTVSLKIDNLNLSDADLHEILCLLQPA